MNMINLVVYRKRWRRDTGSRLEQRKRYAELTSSPRHVVDCVPLSTNVGLADKDEHFHICQSGSDRYELSSLGLIGCVIDTG